MDLIWCALCCLFRNAQEPIFTTLSLRGIAVREDQGFHAVQTVIFTVVCAHRTSRVYIQHSPAESDCS